MALTQAKFDEIMDETESFASLDFRDIKRQLRERYNITDPADIRKFGEMFVARGLEDGWLLDEMGF